jgi:hypothetical protein
MTDTKAPTHTAFALKREGKRHSRWLEIGKGRLDRDNVIHVFLDRTPIGGFNGYVYLSPNGLKPPDPEPQPERPAGRLQEGDV